MAEGAGRALVTVGQMTVNVIVSGVGAISTAAAAAFWFWASMVDVPDNIDTIVQALQRASRFNAYGAASACVAALCAAYGFLVGLN